MSCHDNQRFAYIICGTKTDLPLDDSALPPDKFQGELLKSEDVGGKAAEISRDVR